jgi:hypothetical protein
MDIRFSILLRQSLRSPALLYAGIRSKQWLTEFIRDIPREVAAVVDSPDLTHQIAPLAGGERLSKERMDAVIANIVDRKKTSFTTALMFVFILKKTAEKRASRLRDASAVLKAALRVRDDPQLEDFFKTSLFDLLGCDLEDEYDDLPVKDRRASEFLIAAHIMYTLFWLKAGLFKPGVVGEIRQGEAVVRRGQNLDKAYARDLRNNIFDPFRKGWLRDDNSGACYDKIGAIGEHVARAAFAYFLPDAVHPSGGGEALSAVSRFSGLVSLALQIGEDDIREIHEDLQARTPNTLMWFHLQTHADLKGLDIPEAARLARARSLALLREARDIIQGSAIANKCDYDSVLALAEELIETSQPREIA